MPKVLNKYFKKIQLIVNSNYFKFFIFLLTFIFTFILRAHNYERVPTPNYLDEMIFAWSGLYLIETGVPVSWSTLDYPLRAQVFKGEISYHGGYPKASVTLYKPWLDEPPLFSLIVGYSAHLFHADRTQFVPSSYIRFPVVLMAAVISIMIFLLARMASGFWTGILSMFLYGTIPIFVFASRTAMAESFIAFLLALMIYLCFKFYQKFSFFYIWPLPIMIGLAGLAKPTGFLLLPLIIFLVFSPLFQAGKVNQAIKYSIYLILLTIPFIGIFFWYGLSQDSAIFLRLNDIQSHRPVGFASLTWFFISPSYDTVEFRDSFYVFCTLAAVYFLFLSKFSLNKLTEMSGKTQVILLTFIYWIMIVMISGGENDLLAWYRFGAYPFLAIIGAWGLQLIVRKADIFASFLGAGLLLGNRMLLVNAFRPNIDPTFYRLVFSGLMLPSVLNSVFNNEILKKIIQLMLILVITVGIYFNVIYIYNAFEITCESKTCPIVPQTKLSALYFPVIWHFFVLGEPTYH